MNAAARTHQGLRRRHNEDRHLIREIGPGEVLLAVADGMGGEASGEVAAQMAVDHLAGRSAEENWDEAALVAEFRRACGDIHARAQADPAREGMGTTLTAAYVRGNRVVWAHVVDSRLYLWRDGRLDQITRDHTAAAVMVEQGTLSQAEAQAHPARNMLFDCVGCGSCSPDSGAFETRPGDLILLTSDGLHDAVPRDMVTDILRRPSGLGDRLSALIEAALDAGGRDNITAVGLEL
ncbi:MAG: protein phosphatase 2C domain-containing protein [Proteobacteria bacterium]|nr:protein phosphatase 2C domain-containing protein [Pseudomonadota bacterium]